MIPPCLTLQLLASADWVLRGQHLLPGQWSDQPVQTVCTNSIFGCASTKSYHASYIMITPWLSLKLLASASSKLCNLLNYLPDIPYRSILVCWNFFFGHHRDLKKPQYHDTALLPQRKERERVVAKVEESLPLSAPLYIFLPLSLSLSTKQKQTSILEIICFIVLTLHPTLIQVD